MAQSSAINFGTVGIGSGSTVTDWAPYTPTTQGFGSISNVNMWWRRVGDSVEIMGSFSNGTNTAVEARVGLPSGLTSDATKVSAIRPNGAWTTASVSSIQYGNTLIESNVTYVTFGFRDGSDASNTKQNASSIMPNGTTVYLYNIMVPIAGWSSNTLLSNNAYFNGYMSSSASWTASSGSFVDPTNSGGNTLTTVFSNGITVTAAASNVAGITFTPASATSVYKIIARCAVGSSSSNNAGGGTFRLTDGTTPFGWDMVLSRGSGTTNVIASVQGIFAPGTSSAVTVKIQIATVAGTTNIQESAFDATLPAIQWEVMQIK